MSQTSHPIRLGTRNSPLARWQAEWVALRLGQLGALVTLVPITTEGDRHQAGPIGAIGGQPGVFTKALQQALLDEQIDLAVHSLKDLPTDEIPGLALAAVPERESSTDALVTRGRVTLDGLAQGARVGSGSLRRKAQLWHVRPDLRVDDIRGNVDTRLRKLDEGEYDALVLAEAGLRRLGLADRIDQALPASLMLPAVGQGALGLECRADDVPTRNSLSNLNHPASHAAVLAERALLSTLRGGCLAPIGAWARSREHGKLYLIGTVLSADGRAKLTSDATGPEDAAIELGEAVARALISQGALELIQASRSPTG